MRWIVAKSVILLQLIAASKQAVDSKISIDDRGFFIDEWGRVRIFHGFNAVKKYAEQYPSELLNKTVVEKFKSWGFNAVRVGVIWGAAEPQENKFDERYFGKIKEIVNNLEVAGMYSLLDMHQDVMSSKYDGYDGIPLWLVDALPTYWLKYPSPFTEEMVKESWGLQYVAFEVSKKFQSFYHNTSNSWGHWGKFWKQMAAEFGRKNGVLGYELINEPWAGDIWKHMFKDDWLMFPGNAGKGNLQPAYDYLANEISSIDNETIIFYEPVTWGVLGSGEGMWSSGFDHVPGGESFKSRSAFSYHYYCWPTNIDPNLHYNIYVQILCETLQQDDMFTTVANNKRSLGGGSMLTEFGDAFLKEPEQAMHHADKHFESWTYWYGLAEGTTDEKKLKIFSRAYPRAIAGEPKLIKFDTVTGTLSFQFAIDTEIDKPTEVFLPVDVHYKRGFQVNVSPEMKYEIEDGNLLMISQPEGKNLKNGTLVKVLVSAKL